ncbi:MAG TPA: mercury resistance system transport protein MerF [Alphaproteobacteria bacterium]|nr:mercury resistance system transport protein MerF [Alphaproteobacteria bacterium]
MDNKTLCKSGVVGSVVVAICCFTPALVILLPVIGLAAWLTWIDYVLWPALALFLALTAVAIHRLRQEKRAGVRRNAAEQRRIGAGP